MSKMVTVTFEVEDDLTLEELQEAFNDGDWRYYSIDMKVVGVALAKPPTPLSITAEALHTMTMEAADEVKWGDAEVWAELSLVELAAIIAKRLNIEVTLL